MLGGILCTPMNLVFHVCLYATSWGSTNVVRVSSCCVHTWIGPEPCLPNRHRSVCYCWLWSLEPSLDCRSCSLQNKGRGKQVFRQLKATQARWTDRQATQTEVHRKQFPCLCQTKDTCSRERAAASARVAILVHSEVQHCQKKHHPLAWNLASPQSLLSLG